MTRFAAGPLMALAAVTAIAPVPGRASDEAAARQAAGEALSHCLSLPDGGDDFLASLRELGWTRGENGAVAAFATEVALALVFDPAEPDRSSGKALFLAGLMRESASQRGNTVLLKDGIAIGPFGLGLEPAYCAISGPAALAVAVRETAKLTPHAGRSHPGLVNREDGAGMTLATVDPAALSKAAAPLLPQAIGESDLFGIKAAYVQVVSSGGGG